MNTPDYCTNLDLRKWVFGPDMKCGGNPDECRFVVQIGKRRYCGWCPPRCTLWEVIRDQAHCLFCKHYTKKLSSAVCGPCLSAETRINYKKCEERIADAAALYEKE